MKRCRSLAIALTCLSSILVSFAQMPGGPPNTAFVKLFGTNTGFTAVAEVQVLDKSQKETLRMPMTFFVLGDRLRVDTDMGKIQSKVVPAKDLADAVQRGLDRVNSVICPDLKKMYFIYPRLQSYVEEAADPVRPDLKIQKIPLGRETLDGRSCVKNRTLVKDGAGGTLLEATTWNAADLKDFPIQLLTKEGANTTVMRFQPPQFARPDAKMFDPPAGFRKYPNLEALKNQNGKATNK